MPNPRGLSVFLPRLLMALSPGLAVAAATALGVTLDASAGCGNGSINVTLTTAGANREGWRATNVAGATLVQGEGQTGFNSGTFNGFFPQVFSPSQPAGTQVGSYAYVGDTPPDCRQFGRVLRFLRLHVARRSCCRASVPTGPARRPRSRRSLALLAQGADAGRARPGGHDVLVAGAGGRALSRRT